MPQNHDSRTFFTIGRKISALVLVGLTASVAAIMLSTASVSTLKGDAPVLTLAVRQRMLNQRHIKEAMMIASGRAADISTTRELLNTSAQVLRDGGTFLLGGRTFEVPTPSAELAENFGKAGRGAGETRGTR
jgi:hypothetical protein